MKYQSHAHINPSYSHSGESSHTDGKTRQTHNPLTSKKQCSSKNNPYSQRQQHCNPLHSTTNENVFYFKITLSEGEKGVLLDSYKGLFVNIEYELETKTVDNAYRSSLPIIVQNIV